jgi:GDP-L-fucose synthase|tara:strand:+ start:2649 stop:3608 length:960 start_codon:yes stop_codon:yes gene_type:complete
MKDMIDRSAPVFIAGHRGLVGSAILRRLEKEGFTNLLTATREELDLRRQSSVDEWFNEHQPQYVFLVAGTVGGIGANSTRPADFIYDNLMIHGTVVHASHQMRVEKLLYLGSSCIYPRLANQPMKENELLSGQLEPTNEGYAIAKIAGIKLCESYRRQHGCDFISAMPTNLYGPGDNFDLDDSHVLPALIRRFHEAKISDQKEVEIWGTGSAYREFLHVDDLADACLFLMDNYSESEHINVGTGKDSSIADLAERIRDLVHPEATISFDTSKPDGMPRKVLDVSKLKNLGWESKIPLNEGLASTYDWYLSAIETGQVRL